MKHENNKNTEFLGVDKNFEYDLDVFVDEVVGFANKIDVKDGLKDLESLWKTIGIDLNEKIRKSEEELNIKSSKLKLSKTRKNADEKNTAILENKIADKIREFVIDSSAKTKTKRDKKYIVNQVITNIEVLIITCHLMKEIGLRYLVGNRTEEVIFLLLSDNRVLFGNMEKPFCTMDNIDTNDVAKFNTYCSKPNNKGLHFSLTNSTDDKSIILYPSELGQTLQILHILGSLLADLNKKEEAIKIYEKAIELNPGDSYPYNGLGNVFYSIKELKKAEKIYKKAIELNPGDSYPYNGLAKIFADLGNKNDAINAYQKAIEINPRDSFSYNGLGNVLRSTGRTEEAIELYKLASEINPKDSYPYNGLGNALRSLGRLNEAVEAYKKAIEINPRVRILATV